MLSQAMAYVEETLAAHGADNMRPGQPFRTRSSHMRRVLMWVERLLVQGGVEYPDALRLAAVFHDVGYLRGEQDHGLHSADILRAYGREHGLDAGLVGRAAFLVAEHSGKAKWLPDPHAPRDLVLLMEADLLDEEGAMGLALDCMTAGAQGLGYREAYARMERYEPPRLARNPMVTPLAIQCWKGKQRIIRRFMEAFAVDLGLEHEA